MVAGEDVKLSYNGTLCRIRVSFGEGAVKKNAEPPKDLVSKAKAKLEQEIRSKKIAFYHVYEDRLTKLWEHIRNNPGCLSSKKTIVMSLAAGAPNLPGLQLGPPGGEKSLVSLTIDAPADVVGNWRQEWIELHVERSLKSLGVTTAINPAQIRAALFRASMGDPVKNLQLSAKPAL